MLFSLHFHSSDKVNLTVVNDKEKEQAVATKPSPARSKDQPTLHQFVTPIRKRKRSVEKGESPQTPLSQPPSILTPISNSPSTGTPKAVPVKGSTGSSLCILFHNIASLVKPVSYLN